MPAALALTILWTAALWTFALVLAAAFFVHAIGRGFGARRASPLLVVATIVCLVLHGGLLLGPYWWSSGQRGLGIALMLPASLADVIAVFALTSRLGLPPAGGRLALALAALLGTLAAAVLPIVALSVGPQ